MPLKFSCEHCGKENTSKFLKQGEEYKCSHCGQETQIPANAEWVKEVPPQVTTSGQETPPEPSTTEGRRFGMLSAFASIITALGWLLLVLSPLAFVLPSLSGSGGIEVVLRSGLGALFAALGAIAGGQAIKCIIAVEENSRASRQHLAEIARALAGRPKAN